MVVLILPFLDFSQKISSNLFPMVFICKNDVPFLSKVFYQNIEYSRSVTGRI